MLQTWHGTQTRSGGSIRYTHLRVSVSAQAAHTLLVPFLSEFHIMDIVAILYIVGSVAQVSPHVYMCEFGDGLRPRERE
jgi:hypothetical protein